jgi:hypothetical protein
VPVAKAARLEVTEKYGKQLNCTQKVPSIAKDVRQSTCSSLAEIDVIAVWSFDDEF